MYDYILTCIMNLERGFGFHSLISYAEVFLHISRPICTWQLCTAMLI